MQHKTFNCGHLEKAIDEYERTKNRVCLDGSDLLHSYKPVCIVMKRKTDLFATILKYGAGANERRQQRL